MSLSMHINRSGIKGQQLAMDAIANNIANTSTVGYKAKGVRFQSLIENDIRAQDDVLLNNVTPSISAGTRSEVAVTNHTQGSLIKGNNAYDLSIHGQGYFGVTNGNGDFYLTRNGIFTMDESGQLVNENGDYLVIEGNIPQNINSPLTISKDRELIGFENGQQVIYGTISTFMPENEAGLTPVGQNYYVDPTNSINAFGEAKIESGVLEMSNVDLAQELTNMIMTQRAYGMNVKVAQGTDEMMSIINQFSM